MKVPDIIEKVFRDAGFSEFRNSPRSVTGVGICVQYRETDFNFVSRLMEQEGFTTSSNTKRQTHIGAGRFGERSTRRSPD